LNKKLLFKFFFLYKITVEELKAVKYYIIKNFRKKFIILSSAFFTLFILIV
ncbi:hypothetical protein BO99DRAFT_326579, partial [Aspergillus violaceofuscus CBS 115571]